MRMLPAVCFAGLIGAACLPVVAAEPALGGSCDIVPWQTVNNGMGAEPGVVREFAVGIAVPPECLRGGRTWVPRIFLGMTRTPGSSPDVDVRVSIRAPQSPGGPPGDFRTELTPYTLEGVPLFPAKGTFELDVGPGANQNLNNILWGDYFFPSVDMNGDETALVFLVADEVGPMDMDCFTGVDGDTPTDVCTNGNPNLNEAGVGASANPYYARLPSTGESVSGREPLATTWGARYINPGTTGGSIDLTVWRDSPGGAQEGGQQTICQFSDIPVDFEFQCVMTASELASLSAGEVFVELTGGGPVRNTRVLPADLFIFADGFESGDTSVWSNTVQ